MEFMLYVSLAIYMPHSIVDVSLHALSAISRTIVY